MALLASGYWRHIALGGEVMAELDGVMTPAAAGRLIGIAPSTLRVYSVRLARLLSDAAGRPSEGPGGRPGVRLYANEDVRILTAAKEMLGRGLTYEQVADTLGEGHGRKGPSRDGGARRGGYDQRISEFLGLLDALKEGLDKAIAASEAWRSLAEERGREAESLRSRIAELEGELGQRMRRRSALERLLGR
jgi:DNA-binding transcriptional MerR regulator